MKNYIELEIEIYNKIYEINLKIEDILKSSDFDIERLEKYITKRAELIEEIKKIEEKLDVVWKNWEKYSDEIDKEIILKLKEFLIKNIKKEKEIISLYELKLSEISTKLKEYDRGKRALSGYKIAKVNIPIFKSFKI